MQLTKRGIIIKGCVLCWVMDNDDQQVKLIEASRMMDILDLKGEVTFLSHAPTYEELSRYVNGENAWTVKQLANVALMLNSKETH